VVVEPDLPDRNHLRFGCQARERLPLRVSRGSRVVRMDSHCRPDGAVASCELNRRVRRGQVVAGDEQTLDARRRGPGDDRVAILVEGGILQVAVRVDQALQPLRRARGAQGPSPAGSSTRGKSGLASATCQPVPIAPQAARFARPGPPAPRLS
jgi:hypothetical protein